MTAELEHLIEFMEQIRQGTQRTRVRPARAQMSYFCCDFDGARRRATCTGADLAESLRARFPEIALYGVGGARMHAAGIQLIADSRAWGRDWYCAICQGRPESATGVSSA
jgi:hypothetical protein